MIDNVTHDRLLSVLSYDLGTGIFRWLIAPQRSKPGDIAGFRGGPGYWQIRIDGKVYYAHRLAVFYMTGEWPIVFVDHADGDKINNAWANLRPATVRQNAANMRKRNGKTSLLKGVSRDARNGRWVSFIRIGGKSTYLGTFKTEEQAHEAYCNAASSTFGDFARNK